MNLIYLSPVQWSSYAQRPHKFVEWFHAETQGDVLWIDPYPTRFPLPSDYRRLNSQQRYKNQEKPPWLRIIKPRSLPIEPLPASGMVNFFLWRTLFREIDVFSHQKPSLLVIGKPSALALAIVKRTRETNSIYDAMDDFPAFYSGFSRLAMRRRELELVRRVTRVLASSTALKKRLDNIRPDVQLVHNGLDDKALLMFKRTVVEKKKKVLGYVGTIGYWFDWEWVINLANMRPIDLVRLVGPLFAPAPCVLPKNIELQPACNNQVSITAMQEFDVGLIPFKKNVLTASVDPIKYYEYRALGLPVVSTDFGEMALRAEEDGVFICRHPENVCDLIQKAILYHAKKETTTQFIAKNNWAMRFESAKIIQLLI